MASRGDAREDRTEKQIVALLTLPLTAYDPVTVLGLSTYPHVMSLLKPATCKVPQLPFDTLGITELRQEVCSSVIFICLG